MITPHFFAMQGLFSMNNPTVNFLLCQIHRMRCIPTTEVSHAAVSGGLDGTFTFYYNPETWEQLSNADKTTLLLHEGMHVVLAHCYRGALLHEQYIKHAKDADQQQLTQLLQYASDFACNCELRTADLINPKFGLGKGALYPEQFGLESGLSMEEYFVQLLNQMNEGTLPNALQCGNTDNDMIKGIQKTLQQIAEDYKKLSKQLGSTDVSANTQPNMENALRGAINNAGEQLERAIKTWGIQAGHLTELCNKLKPNTKVPFTKIMRTAVATALRDKRRTMQRCSRRRAALPLNFPGKRARQLFKIVWITDTSASMSTAQISEGLACLEQLCKTRAHTKVIVIEADAEVQKVYELSNESTAVQREVKGGGGTSFDPALKEAARHAPDIVFYYTDGYAEAPTVKLRCPVYWIIAPHGTQIPGERNVPT